MISWINQLSPLNCLNCLELIIHGLGFEHGLYNLGFDHSHVVMVMVMMMMSQNKCTIFSDDVHFGSICDMHEHSPHKDHLNVLLHQFVLSLLELLDILHSLKNTPNVEMEHRYFPDTGF